MGKKRKIRNTLIGVFMIPVALIVMLGWLSYQRAATSLMAEYENSVKATVQAVGNYCDLLCDTVEVKMNELIIDDSVHSYYGKYAGENNSEAMDILREVKTAFTTAKGTCRYIYGYYVIAEKGVSFSSTAKAIPENAFKQLSEEGKLPVINGNKGVWSGYHKELDGMLGLSEDD